MRNSRLIQSVIYFLILGMLSGCLVTREQMRRSEAPQGATFGGTAVERGATGQDRLAEVEAFVRELNGRLGALENQTQEKLRASEVASQEKLVELDRRLTAIVEELALLRADIEKQTKSLSESRVSVTPQASAGASGNASTFDQAEKLFKERNWKQAILKYQEYRDKNPRGKSFAEATYKIGVCFQELGMSKEAKTFYDEVVSRFPNTPQARRAQTRTKALRL